MKHLGSVELALFAGGDLGFWRRWRLRAHLRGCPECRGEVEAFKRSREALRASEGALPAWVNWDRLAEEMSGNIRVGLAADQCVEGRFAPRRRHLTWMTAVAVCLSLASFAIFWIDLPSNEARELSAALHAIVWKATGAAPLIPPATPASGELVIEASPTSVGMEQNGSGLSLLARPADRIDISVSMQNSAGARYVDADTGQVTINRVYYEQ